MRFWVAQVTGVAIFLAGWAEGTVSRVFYEDQTYMVWLILVLAIYGIWRAAEKKSVDNIADVLIRLGLLGTAMGFTMALIGIADSDVSARDAGVQTALYTTICGMIGSLWIEQTAKLR